MKRAEGIRIARRFREALLARGYPVRRVLVFGSVALDTATEDSDIDVAVVCDPFAPTRQEEIITMRQHCWDLDVRVEPFSLHADDFEKPYFALPREVERDGIEV